MPVYMMRLFIVLMFSLARKDGAEYRTFEHLEALPSVKSVWVLGECPAQNYPKIVCIGARKNIYHRAYEILPQPYHPTRFLCPGGSWCGEDDQDRVQWRTHLALDMLSGLMYAQKMLPVNSTFVWLENDAQFLPQNIPDYTQAPFSCYGTTKNYNGFRTVCFVLKNDKTLLSLIQCLVAKHMVMPADWIVADCMTMPAYNAAKHLGKISTRIQNK